MIPFFTLTVYLKLCWEYSLDGRLRAIKFKFVALTVIFTLLLYILM